MGGCGSAVDSLNDDEKLIYDALTSNIDTFNNPSSIQIVNCSDLFPNEDKYFVSTNNEYFYCNLLGEPNFSFDTDNEDGWIPNDNYGKEKCVMIQINAENRSGGKSSTVFCLCVEGIDKGSMYQYNEVMASFDDKTLSAHDTSNEKEKLRNKEENLRRRVCYLQLRLHANGLGYYLADENENKDYPISSGKRIDTSKLNKAIKEYLTSKGLL